MAEGRKLCNWTACKAVDFGPVKATRFFELKYQRQGASWRILDASTMQPVGPAYSTRQALLDDFERFAEAFGCLETKYQP